MASGSPRHPEEMEPDTEGGHSRCGSWALENDGGG